MNRTDAASIYRRDTSRDWWQTQAGKHELFISAEVLTELSSPTYPMSQQALDWVSDTPLLPINEEVIGFAEVLARRQAMPAPVAGDAIHVAVATVHDLDYVLSWNVRHLANPN